MAQKPPLPRWDLSVKDVEDQSIFNYYTTQVEVSSKYPTPRILDRLPSLKNLCNFDFELFILLHSLHTN
jgi:hypothetical protein